MISELAVCGVRTGPGRRLRRGLAGVGLVLACWMATPARAAEVEFRDDFDATTLGPGWTFVREIGSAWSLSERPGFVRIETRRGTFTEDSEVQNLLVRPISGDFILETRLEFDPRAAQQFAGLLVYEDDAHAVALGLAWAEGELGVFRGVAMLGVGEDIDPNAQPPVSFYDEDNTSRPDVIYLRLLRKGDQFVGALSPDGETYSDIGILANTLADEVLVGVGAANGDFPECGSVCDAPVEADFDFFQISRIDGDDPDDPNVDAVLEEVTITGPAEVAAGASANYIASAFFSDDTSRDVTQQVEWMLAPANAGQISDGRLEVGTSTQGYVTVAASYTQLTSGGEVRRLASRLVRVQSGDQDPPAGRAFCGTGLMAFVPLLVPALAFCRWGRSRTGVAGSRLTGN